MSARHSVITNDEEGFDFDPDEIDVYEDVEEDEEEEEDGETEESGQENPQQDWESRFRGLQGALQRSQESLATVQQEAFVARAEAVRTQLASQGLEPQEADRQFKMWLLTQANEYQARQNASDREALEYASRGAYLQQLVNHYQIDVKSPTFARLSRIKDPEDMRAFAEEVATREQTTKKTVKKAQRKAQGADKFDSGGGRVGSPPKKKAKTLDDAAAMLSKYKIDF